MCAACSSYAAAGRCLCGLWLNLSLPLPLLLPPLMYGCRDVMKTHGCVRGRVRVCLCIRTIHVHAYTPETRTQSSAHFRTPASLHPPTPNAHTCCVRGRAPWARAGTEHYVRRACHVCPVLCRLPGATGCLKIGRSRSLQHEAGGRRAWGYIRKDGCEYTGQTNVYCIIQ